MPHPHHDRLDLRLDVHQYSDAKCGSVNLKTEQKDYCCQECPTFAEEFKMLPPDVFERLKALLPK